jgi:4'-phosphopantetheinyl transferase
MSLITISDIGCISWNQINAVPSFTQGEIQIWRVRVPQDNFVLTTFQHALSKAELDRASRFVQPEDAQRYVAAHGALRNLLSMHTGIAPRQLEFTKNEFGKPALAHPDCAANIHFNLSHSGRYIVIALSKQPIGVDVELVKNDFNFRGLLPHYFSPTEAHSIIRSPSPVNAFFRSWTCKEALGKGLGLGISENMQQLPCLNGTHQSTGSIMVNDWKVQTFGVDDVHVASVAYSSNIASVNFYDYAF